MSEPDGVELMILVERVVRPLLAPHSRLMTLRQELLAHVEQIHAEEIENGSAPAVALARTQERFGNPDEIRRHLQLTVPLHERFSSWFESLFRKRPGESDSAFAIRCGLKVGGLHFVLLFAAILALSIIQWRSITDYIPGFMALLCLTFAVDSALVTGLTQWVVKPYLIAEHKTIAPKGRLIAGTAFVALCLSVSFLGLVAWSTTDAGLMLRTVVLSVAASATVFPTVCLAYVRERLAAQPWLSLDIT